MQRTDIPLPGKFQVFMTKAVFTGAHVGPGGMSPGSRKLTVVVNWKVPEEGVHNFLDLAL